MTRPSRDQLFYLLLLSDALIEIRSLGTEGGLTGDLETARGIADVFHNIPAALAKGISPEQEESLHAQIRGRASARGLLPILEAWERHAEERIARGKMV